MDGTSLIRVPRRTIRGGERFLGWFTVAAVLIGLYGEVTAPLLLALAADVAVGKLIFQTMAERRDAAAWG